MSDIIVKLTGARNDRLVELRKSANKTIRQVAADLRITDSMVRNLEKGRGLPSVSLMFRMAHYYGTDVYDAWSAVLDQVVSNSRSYSMFRH